MAGLRGRRVAETIKLHLTQALTRELQDRRLAHVVITEVAIADDLGVARVSVRLMVGDEDPKQRQVALRVLTRVAGRLRRSLAPKLGLKRVPELRFSYDTGLDYSRRVDELLREIASETGEPTPEEVPSETGEPTPEGGEGMTSGTRRKD